MLWTLTASVCSADVNDVAIPQLGVPRLLRRDETASTSPVKYNRSTFDLIGVASKIINVAITFIIAGGKQFQRVLQRITHVF